MYVSDHGARIEVGSVRARRVLGYANSRPVRVVLLVELVAAFIAVLGIFSPVSSSLRALQSDVASGKTHVVEYDNYGDSVAVQWSYFGGLPHQFLYRPSGFVADQSTLPEMMIKEVGPKLRETGQEFTFRDVDLSHDFGGIAVLVFASYPLLIQWAWLNWLTVAIGFLVLIDVLLSAPRGMRFSWFWICLFTGFGFYAWLWRGPTTIWPSESGAVQTVKGALGATVVSLLFLVALGGVLVATNLA
jgi:hypothetical protein